MLRAGFNKTSVRAMSADRIQRKTARTMSLHRTCVVEKIAVRGQKIVICARIPFLNSACKTMSVHN